ncbi:MAG TPA: sugar ABC transporter permease [Ktedonobacteraceae bacterium]|nr:sugar ABC transporter permease [Ktedonobacteraceae bacterium]
MEYQAQAGQLASPKAISSKSNTRRRRVSDALWGYVFILPQFVGLLVFAFIPLVAVFYLSMVSWDGLGSIQFVGFKNFIDQFTSDDLHIALTNTFIYTIISVPGGIIVSLLLALGVNRVRGKDIYRLLYFMPQVTSPVAIAVIWLWLLNNDFGLINVLLKSWFHIQGPGWLTDDHLVIPSIAIVSIWASVGFNMIIFLAGLQGIPDTYAEAARIDGANRFQLFWRVTLPLLSPTLFFATVIAIIGSFQVFDLIYVLTAGGPGKDSYVMVYHLYHLAFEQFTFGPASAAAVILFGLILIFTLIQFTLQRYWVHYES